MDSRRAASAAAFAAAFLLKPHAAAGLSIDATALASRPPRELRSMMDEASALWRPQGVTLLWLTSPAERALPGTRGALTVVPDDATVRDASRLGTSRLGAVVFVDGNAGPEPTLALSVVAVGRLVDEALWIHRRVADWPPVVRDDLVGRALGRVVAHEIGHYLLAWRGHTPDGLMRADFRGDRLIDPDRRPFSLSTAMIPRLRGRLEQLSGRRTALAAVD